MSDIKKLIDHCAQEARYLGMANLARMAAAADTELARKDAALEALQDALTKLHNCFDFAEHLSDDEIKALGIGERKYIDAAFDEANEAVKEILFAAASREQG